MCWGIGCVWGGGFSQGIGTHPAYAVFHPGQLRNRSFQTSSFFSMVTTHNDRPSYVKHVLGTIDVTFMGIGCVCVCGGGAFQRIGTQPAYAVLPPGQLKNGSFQTSISFWIL